MEGIQPTLNLGERANNGLFGNDSIWVFAILALLWGGNGFGGRGGYPSDYARPLMRSKGAALKGCNEYDLAYALNMAWSDYSGILGGEEPVIRVAMAFLNDKDAPEGKAYLYWKRVIKGE